MLQVDRRTFAAAIAAAICMGAAAPPERGTAPPKILFVCQYGSVKSAIARELFKRRAAQQNIAVSTVSRGITPKDHLSEELKSRLAAERIDPKAEPLRKLDQGALDSADMVIFFDPLPAGLRSSHAIDWSDLPSMLKRYPDARADLDRRIESLLDRLTH